jgi:hypothetical protein
MSSRDKTMISSVFGVFMALQDDVRAHLRKSDGVSSELKQGLLDVHKKLAEYFRKLDASSYYICSACEFRAWDIMLILNLPIYPVLDPQTTYHGCLNAVGDDFEFRCHILDSKFAFELRFRSQYGTLPPSPMTASSLFH